MLPIVTAEDFATKILKADLPVLVVFSASWCSPCKTLKPYVAKAAKQYASRILCFVLDIDEADAIARKYRVLSIPQLALFVDGKVHGVVVGVSSQPWQDIEDLLAPVL